MLRASYYLVLLNSERVSKAQKSVERFEKAYKDTKVKYENQNALKSDMNRAYLNFSNSKYQLKVTQDSIKSSMAGLAQLIGLPVDATLELSDKLPSEIKQPDLPEYPDLKGAELTRVELRAELQQMQVNKLQLNKINYQYIPSLNGYGYIGGQGLDNTSLAAKDKWFWTSYIGMRLNVPIFDGLQKMALARQQKFVVQKNENNIKTIRNNINYQLQTSAINYANAAKNLELIKENVKLAEEVVKDVNVRYANSVATFQEVLDAETTLKETEFNYLQSLYTFLLAELEWKKAKNENCNSAYFGIVNLARMSKPSVGSVIFSVVKRFVFPWHLWKVVSLQWRKKTQRVFDDAQLKLYSKLLPGGFLHYGYFDNPAIEPMEISYQ